MKANGEEITAKTARGLQGAARRAGLIASASQWYVP
jgi:hypothetical protein